jgi:short-subunit dehydrogenase
VADERPVERIADRRAANSRRIDTWVNNAAVSM